MNARNVRRRIPLQLLVVVAVAGLCAAARADLNVPVSLSGPAGATSESAVEGQGSVTNFSISVTFNNLGNFVYASDLIVGIVAPNGAAIEFGGEGLSLDGYDGITFANAGVFAGSWRSENNGVRTHGPVNLGSFGLAGGPGIYRVILKNGWEPSPGASWTGSVTIGGVITPPDADGDGILDDVDPCPNSPNVYNASLGIYYPTIQDAINAASSGHVIELGECTFYEDNITFPNGVNLTIQGAGRDLTIIDGGGGTDNKAIFQLLNGGQTNATIISDLTLRNGVNTQIDGGGAVRISSTSPTFRRVNFVDNGGPGGNNGVAHVRISGGNANPIFSQCRFSGGHDAYTCLSAPSPATAKLIQCLLADNATYTVLHLEDASSVVNSTISATGTNYGVSIFCYTGSVQVVNSVIRGAVWANGGSINRSWCLFNNASGNNINAAPAFVDEANGDYHLAPGTPGIDAASYDAYVAAGGDSSDLNGDLRAVDTCRVNSGSGAVSYLDIGAYETQSDGPDSDSDGVADVCDGCPGFDDNLDADADGISDGCDLCAGSDDNLDADADGIPDGCDNCLNTFNPDQLDGEGPNTSLSPVAAWHFDENGGTTAGDVVGGHTGNSTTVGWSAAGRHGSAVEFPTGGSSMSVPGSADFDLTDQLTISLWIKPSAFPVTISRLLTRGGPTYVFRLQNRKPHFYVRKGGVLTGSQANVLINADKWTHLAAVWDGLGDGLLRIFINGEEAAAYDFQGTVTAPIDATGGGVLLGSLSGERYEGLMDELGIFNKALSESEIQTLMVQGLGDGIGDACDSCPDAPNVVNITQGTYHQTIQAAIDASAPGDVIELGACTILERGIVLHNKSVTLRGQGAESTVIDGDHVPGVIFTMENGDASVLENISIQNGVANSGNGGVVSVESSSSTTFRHCIFKGNDAGPHRDGALEITGAAARLEACAFADNTSGRDSSAIGASFGASMTLINCLFHGNGGAATTVLAYQSTVNLLNCTFVDQLDQRILQAQSNGSITAGNNVFHADAPVFSGDITISTSVYAGATGTNIDGVPTIVDAANGDYRLAPGSLGLDAADYDVYVAVGGGATDLAGATRTVDSCIDDTGVGSVTYLDMGAYESQSDGPDDNGNGVPDICDGPCGTLQIGDVDANGLVDVLDADSLTAFLLDDSGASGDQHCAADVNQDGSVDGRDVQAFVNLLLTQ
ncbi:MAG: hypothetical protein IPK83_22190 [Planctomycetes bacterium]|nr:hypothetical protein [Planctomycetota bacterium]